MSEKNLSRRDFLRASLIAAAGTVLAACGAQETPEPEAEGAESVGDSPEAEEVTLNFLNRGGEYIAGVVDQQIKLYKESHPEVSFEINAVPGYSHQETLLMMIAGGVGPDFWFDANRTTGMLAHKGVAENLEPLLEADPDFNEDDFVDNVWVAQTYDGDRWGIPWDSGAMYMTFSKDLFDEVGLEYPDPKTWLTWDEIVEMAKQLTFDMDGNTPNDSGFDPDRISQYGLMVDKGHGMWTFIYANGGEVIASDRTMPLDSPEFTEAMNWIADLALVEHVSPTPGAEQATELDMRSKNVAMQHTGAWTIGRYNDAGLNWGMFPVPYNTARTSYGHYSPMCVFAESEYIEEAYNFVFFAGASKEGSSILVDLGMQQPIRKDLREDFLNEDDPPEEAYRQVAYDAFENEDTFRWPGDTIGSYFGGWYQPLLDVWAPYKDQLWLGEVRWEDISVELREKSEQVLETGEVS